MTQKIITVCSAGLVRSAALADVLKMHFEQVDVVPVGINRNSSEEGGVLPLLFGWADTIVVMHEPYVKRIPEEHQYKVVICEVGQDTYHTPRHPGLIDFVWRWTRENLGRLNIQEHSKKL